MREATGDFIYINWDNDQPEAEYVRGHVSPDDAVGTVCSVVDMPEGTLDVKHRWARYIPRVTSEYDMMIRFIDEQRRGCFAVTEVRYPTGGS